MGKANVHVVPHERGWAVKREGADRASVVKKTQREADGVARQIATRDSVECVTHGKDGRIRSKDSFGPDPHPPVDKEH